MSDRDAKDMTIGPGDMLTPEILRRMMPKADGQKWALPISLAMAERQIIGPRRVAHFLAQLGHESIDLTHTSENLHYTAPRLCTGPLKARFPTMEIATRYAAAGPEAIANHAYAGRHGNGDEASGDGWRYRGGGLIQLTFKANYAAAGEGLGLDLVAHPELVREDPDVAARTAAWYWDSRHLNDLADIDDVDGITRAINGGYTGLEDRKARLAAYKIVLGST